MRQSNGGAPMLETVVEFLKQDITDLKIEMREDFAEVNLKIDSLLAFKWQMIGASVVASALAGIVTTMVLKVMGS